MNPFKTEYQYFEPQINKALKRTLQSGRYILGNQLAAFEKNFADYIGTKYCIGVANGLEALQISLMSLGIGKGDEVITVANSAVATALAITNIGAKPVFVDINDYFLMDIDKVEEKITKKTKAVIPVHLFGQAVDMKKLIKVAKKHKIIVIEDACQAHGASSGNKKAGSIGNIGCFSFYPTKNLAAYGDGGAITTDSKQIYEKCKMLRNYGQKDRYRHLIEGMNSRLDEIQAAILTEKLKKLDLLNKSRNKLAKIYRQNLKDISQITVPKTANDNYHVYHQFVIKAEKRLGLMEFLKKNKIETLIHYPIPIHKQKCYRQFNKLSLPKTEETARKILSLPINPYMKKGEILMVCSLIKRYYKGKNYEK